jgi:hypothetical protein
MLFRLVDQLHPARLVAPLHANSCFFARQFSLPDLEAAAHARAVAANAAEKARVASLSVSAASASNPAAASGCTAADADDAAAIDTDALSLDELRERGVALLGAVAGSPADGANASVVYASWRALNEHPVFVALAAARCRVLLEFTMGSPHTFELRRAELAEMRREKEVEVATATAGQQSGSSSHAAAAAAAAAPRVTDAEVVASIRAQLAPTGALTAYCRDAHLAIVVGACVFVHGSLSGDIIAHAQGRPFDAFAAATAAAHSWASTTAASSVDPSASSSSSSSAPPSPLHAWAAASTAANARSFAAYAAAFDERERDTFRRYFAAGAAALPALWCEAGGYGYSPVHDAVYASMGTDGGKNPPSPIYSSFNEFYKHERALKLDAKLSAALRAARVTTIVCGHNPHGDGVVSLRFPADDAAAAAVDSESVHEQGSGAGTVPPPSSRVVRVHCVDNSYAANVNFADGVDAGAADARPFAPSSPRALAGGADPRGRLSSTALVADTRAESAGVWLVGTLSNGQAYVNRIDGVDASGRRTGTAGDQTAHVCSDGASAQQQPSEHQVRTVAALSSRWIGRKLALRRGDGLHERHVLVKHVLDDGTLATAETAGYVVTNFRVRAVRKQRGDGCGLGIVCGGNTADVGVATVEEDDEDESAVTFEAIPWETSASSSSASTISSL